MHQYIPNTEEEQLKMLNEVGIASFEDLLKRLPQELRFRGELPLPPAKSEWEHKRDVQQIISRDGSSSTHISFLGAGSYDHFIPHIVDVLVSRSEFYTAYTPYQAEVSQGTLQAMYEYQSMICELTSMDLANSSMYDGASAMAEACLLASRHTNRNKILISRAVNPIYLDVAITYAHNQGLEFEMIDLEQAVTSLKALDSLLNQDVAGVVIQNPNFYGGLEDLAALKSTISDHKVLLIAVVNPISLNLLESPGKLGVDIAVGEGQSLGNHMSFGGPYLGFMAVKEALIRKVPGRIAGESIDIHGNRAFVMVLRTREQDIRRERATSNICTNQGLNALTACIYMSTLGKNGLRRVAELCTQKAHYLAEGIAAIKGYKLETRHFFNEFVIEVPGPAKDLIRAATQAGFFAGVALSQFEKNATNKLLLAVTEKRSKTEMDALLDFFRGYSE
ncbi:MAG: aminomethyl-transferring glycine dehydrogenase subunit GcvPA [Candidatus Marinimicrobia bacterium]|nr:aminomethyl-transferring glycine dehydrogenase subunit GcvPA [Candidatus Neomarinimicrobiota bacterium]